jgi:hypothetical protein
MEHWIALLKQWPLLGADPTALDMVVWMVTWLVAGLCARYLFRLAVREVVLVVHEEWAKLKP